MTAKAFRVCDAIERNERHLKEKVLYLISETERINREHGFNLCYDRLIDIIYVTDYYIGGPAGIYGELGGCHETYELIGTFHTHPTNPRSYRMSETDIMYAVEYNHKVSLIGTYYNNKPMVFIYSFPYLYPSWVPERYYKVMKKYNDSLGVFGSKELSKALEDYLEAHNDIEKRLDYIEDMLYSDCVAVLQ